MFGIKKTLSALGNFAAPSMVAPGEVSTGKEMAQQLIENREVQERQFTAVDQAVNEYFRTFEESIRFADYRGFVSSKRAQVGLSTYTRTAKIRAVGVRVATASREIITNLVATGAVHRHLEQQGANFSAHHLFFSDGVPALWVFRTDDKEESNEVFVTGDDRLTGHFIDQIREKLPNDAREVVNVQALTANGLQSETGYIKYGEVDLAHPEFYPWLVSNAKEKTHTDPDTYMRDFMESRGSVLLLIGPPGTGKTTFLRHFIMKLEESVKVMMTANKNVAMSEDLIMAFQSSDAEVLVMEDADQATRRREDGNDAMSSLLNVANGILTKRKKIIISTNLPSTDKVDEALLRPGRCYGILEFRRLTQGEALAAWKVVNPEEEADFSGLENWSLAQILNVNKDNGTSLDARKPRSIGFGTP